MKPAISHVLLELSSKIHHKIVGHSKETDRVFAIQIKDGRPLGMPKEYDSDFFSNAQKFRQLDFDPFKVDIRDEDITPAERRTRDLRVQTIRPLLDDARIFDPVWRNSQINFISGKMEGLKRTTIYNLLPYAWAFGPDNNALLPNFRQCGGPGKRKNMTVAVGPVNNVPKHRRFLTPIDIEKIQKGFKKHYRKNTKNSLRSAYIDFQADENYRDGEAPTLKQFIYWGNITNDPYTTAMERAGKVKASKDLRLLHGTARDGVFGPCSEIMIDSTIDNVRVVQVSNPARYIGRLTIYLCVDAYSAMVVGFYITPEHASYSTACLSIINIAEDKVEFCKRFGIDITHDQWPCYYLAGRLLADRAELLSNMSSTLTSSLGIDVSNTKSQSPDMKAYVEKQIDILQSRLKGVIGTENGLVDKNDESRITQDSRKNAVLNTIDLTKMVIEEILFYNKTHWMADYPMTQEMRAAIPKPTPIEIFNYGVTMGLGNLRRVEKHVIWRSCMPRRNGVVSKEGIMIKPHYYTPVNAEDENIINKIRFSANHKCEVAFHPSYFKDSYLLYENNFYPLRLRNAAEYLNYFEFEDFVENLSERKVLHDRESEKDEVTKRRRIRAIVGEAQKRRAKKVITNDADRFRKQEINEQRENIIKEMKAPNDKSNKTIRKTDRQKPTSTSAFPSLIKDLRNLKF